MSGKSVAVEGAFGASAKVWLRSRLLRHTGFLIGTAGLVLIVLMAVCAPLLASHDPYAQDLAKRLIEPVWFPTGTWSHPLGTDELGRDYLSRLVYGARISLLIGLTATAMSAVIGMTLGIIGGYFGGRIDAIVTFLITVRLAMPVVLIALAVVAVAGASLWIVILVLGLLLWDRFAVVTRSATMQIRSHDYVAAAKSCGASTLHILVSEILPNILNAIIVVATLEMAHAILLEAALSFLGLGVPPPLPSWGLMVAEAKKFMFFSPWLIMIPGLALFTMVLSINLIGDGLRDITAPENRN